MQSGAIQWYPRLLAMSAVLRVPGRRAASCPCTQAPGSCRLQRSQQGRDPHPGNMTHLFTLTRTSGQSGFVITLQSGDPPLQAIRDIMLSRSLWAYCGRHNGAPAVMSEVSARSRSPLMWIMDPSQEARVEGVQVSLLASACPGRHSHALRCGRALQRRALRWRRPHARHLELQPLCRQCHPGRSLQARRLSHRGSLAACKLLRPPGQMLQPGCLQPGPRDQHSVISSCVQRCKVGMQQSPNRAPPCSLRPIQSASCADPLGLSVTPAPQ